MATAVDRCLLEVLTVLVAVPRALKKNCSISYANVVVVTSVAVVEKTSSLTIAFLFRPPHRIIAHISHFQRAHNGARLVDGQALGGP